MRMIIFKSFYKLLNLIFNHLLMMLIVNIIHSCIDSKYFHSFLSAYPFLVSFMNCLDIFDTDVLFSFSVPNLYSLEADLWRTF